MESFIFQTQRETEAQGIMHHLWTATQKNMGERLFPINIVIQISAARRSLYTPIEAGNLISHHIVLFS